MNNPSIISLIRHLVHAQRADQQLRNYVSRAHGVPIPQHHVREAVKLVLNDVALRDGKRVQNAERKAGVAAEKGIDASVLKKDKFDESIDIAIETGLDPRKPNQSLRGSVRLPHGTGKKVRVAAFCNDEDQQAAAREAGASIVGGTDLIDDISKGAVLNFDRAVATPDIASSLGRVARILGPRGLLPAAKLGTINQDIAGVVSNQLSGLAHYRTDKKGDIHACLGKASFGEMKLLDNIRVFMQELNDEKPEGSKGDYLKQVYLTSTQGKGFKVTMPSIDPSSSFFMIDEVDEENLLSKT
eukprot:CAMPEP_0116067512 /NCGR_PEP_ID=MMETSP0322-20121206/11072_1 /TAXON_ID=163516 /ORGANISM="Leptocylindrus danicus var. apora, Strain B651" /LENGTH=298 /DNA_ID=CAMNT_0003554371 /DNA_START=38 /DNA_END=934 /DNA_ORIENTATION=-